MTFLPIALEWNGRQFEHIAPAHDPVILVADSWRVHQGSTWGLPDHVARFMRGIKAQAQHIRSLPELEPQRFTSAIQHELQNIARHHPDTDLFPRVSVETYQAHSRAVLLVRPAPKIRTTTSLYVPNYTDPRTRPTVKGPDIDLMRGLVAEAPADDVVLHDGTNVIETTTGALLVWHTPTELVLCAADHQLASISAQRIAHHARSRHVSVTSRPVTIQELATGEYPVWFTNTLHGISPVTAIRSDSKETLLASHPDTAAWQTAWRRRFASVHQG